MKTPAQMSTPNTRMPVDHLVMVGAALVAIYHLYAALAGGWPLTFLPPVGTYAHRHTHIGALLALLFFQRARSLRGVSSLLAGLIAIVVTAITAFILVSGSDMLARTTSPLPVDLIVGTAFILLVLEGCRRTTGPVVPITALAFLAYALLGRYFPQPWGHRGYSFERLIGHLFISPEGIYGTPTGVSASTIIVFTIYGSVLMASGAAKYFVDFSLGLFGYKRRGVVRAVTLASFLLGGPSGSGVATTILIGNVSYPLLARTGYGPAEAGGFLAAGGLGAVLSPPVLGSAAFVMAEFLGISYLDVLKMVIVPTAVYYLSLLAVADRARPHSPSVSAQDAQYPSPVPLRWGIAHFVAIGSVLVFMFLGYSPETAAVFATTVALLCWASLPSFPKTAWAILGALGDGAARSIGIAAVCATAGLIIGVISLTGLGLKLGGILTFYAGTDLMVITLLSVVVIMVVGLAVPVTASYIICAVIVVPALVGAGIPSHLSHMLVFYFSVLSEVSPPTAMAPFAAAAITGADPIGTTMQTWRFVTPIAALPVVAILEPLGGTLFLDVPAGAGALELTAFVVSYLAASVALVSALSGDFSTVRSGAGRLLCFVSAILLFVPWALGQKIGVEPWILQAAGLALLGLCNMTWIKNKCAGFG